MLLDRLLDNLALTVEVFSTCRVAPGWRLRLPALDWVTLHFVLQGMGSLRDAEGKIHTLAHDSLAIVPPHLAHAIECGQQVQHEATVSGGPPGEVDLPDHVAGPHDAVQVIVVCGRVHVAYGGSVGLFDQLGGVLILDFSAEPAMRATFSALLEEQQAARPGGHLMMSALMNQCLVQVFRYLCQHPDCRLVWLQALEDPGLAHVLEVVLAHPERSYSVESLAGLAYMSRSAFARRFRGAFGRTPMDYVRGVRLRRAAQLLRRDPPLSVNTVARRVGFASRSQFTRAFQAFFGSAPTEFRVTNG